MANKMVSTKPTKGGKQNYTVKASTNQNGAIKTFQSSVKNVFNSKD